MMTNETRHRIWAFASLSWLAFVVLPTTTMAIRWHLGLGRDSDMSSVFELISVFIVVSSLPATVIAFGLLAPLAIAVDRATRIRTTRAANVALGALLGVIAFVLFGAGSALLRLMRGSLDRPIGESVWRLLHDPRTLAIVAMFVIGGMVVGLGLRYRGESVAAN
jgi:hypothetical protein